MAKRKSKDSAGEPASTQEMIRTIHGEDVPLSKLGHIAPHLRLFAIRAAVLRQDPDNARRHGKEDLASTAASLKRFGQQELIQFNATTKIVKVGNGRHAAAQRLLEWEYVAAVGSNLTTEELRAFALAHNRTAEKSEWDLDKLTKELDALSDLEGQVEELTLEEMGFSSDDLEDLQEDAERKAQSKTTAAEDKTAKSVEGTIYQVVISCGSDRQQQKVLAALEKMDLKALGKALTGLDVRARTA